MSDKQFAHLLHMFSLMVSHTRFINHALEKSFDLNPPIEVPVTIKSVRTRYLLSYELVKSEILGRF